jgi:hypothetical protein
MLFPTCRFNATLQESMRFHLLFLLDIPSLSDLSQVIGPPTKEELLAFKRRDIGCIQITAKQGEFRLDYNSSSKSDFNREALDVFIEDFTEKISEGWYRDKVNDCHIEGDFLQREYILLAVDQHFQYVKQRYMKEVKNPVQGQKAREQQAAARSRRKTWVLIRFYVLIAFIDLKYEL